MLAAHFGPGSKQRLLWALATRNQFPTPVATPPPPTPTAS